MSHQVKTTNDTIGGVLLTLSATDLAKYDQATLNGIHSDISLDKLDPRIILH